MFKGYVSGLLSGLVLSVSGFVVASVVTPLPERFAAEPRRWVPEVYEGPGLGQGGLPEGASPEQAPSDAALAPTDLAEGSAGAQSGGRSAGATDETSLPIAAAPAARPPLVMPPPVLVPLSRQIAATGTPSPGDAAPSDAAPPKASEGPGKGGLVMPPPVLRPVPPGQTAVGGPTPSDASPPESAPPQAASPNDTVRPTTVVKAPQVMPPPVLVAVPPAQPGATEAAGPEVAPEAPTDLAGLPPQSLPPQLPLSDPPPAAGDGTAPEAPAVAAPDLTAGAPAAPELPGLPPGSAASPDAPTAPEADRPVDPPPQEDAAAPDLQPAPAAPEQEGDDAAPLPETDLPPEAPRDAGDLATSGAEGRPAVDPGRGRLPQIGGAPPPAEATPSPPAAPAVPGLGDLDAALARNARPFANPDHKAPFVILLRDTGRQDLDLAALAASDLPMTLVVDPAQPQAAERAAAWRAAGQEVALLSAALPAGATARDVEVTLEGLDQLLPQALAVVEAGSGQGGAISREMAARLVPGLKSRGFGLVSWDAGLRQADQVARREGLPAARIFRDLDAKDEAAPVIRRYLDRAAFKAQQDGHVLVMGDLRPETLAAVHEWSLEGRVSGLALAPLSAVLQPAP